MTLYLEIANDDATRGPASAVIAPAVDPCYASSIVAVHNGREYPDRVIGVVWPGNALSTDCQLPDGCAGRFLAAPSGTLGAGHYDAEPRNWLGPGRAALDAVLERWLPVLRPQDCRLVLMPHARHVLNDVQSSLLFLGDYSGAGVKLALKPGDLLEISMLEDAADHLERIFAGLGPVCAMIFLEGMRPDRERDRVVSCPLDRSFAPLDELCRLIEVHVPADTPIVVGCATGGDRRSLRETLELLRGIGRS